MDTRSTFLLTASSGLVCASVVLGLIRIVPVLDSLAKSRLGKLNDQAESLMMGTGGMLRWLRLWCVLLAGLPIVAWMCNLQILSIVFVLLVYVAPDHIVRFLINRRRTKIRDQLVPAIQGLANAAQAGLTLHQGITEVNRDTPQPLRREFARILADYHRGRPLGEAIEEVRQRLSLESFTLFSTAVQTSMERGGRINEALVRIGNSLRENQRLERKLEADTSAGRREVLILSLFPLVFGVLMYCMGPEGSTEKFWTTSLGQIVVLVVIALVYFGARWALKLMDVQN
jgi:tight adherence protein B